MGMLIKIEVFLQPLKQRFPYKLLSPGSLIFLACCLIFLSCCEWPVKLSTEYEIRVYNIAYHNLQRSETSSHTLNYRTLQSRSEVKSETHAPLCECWYTTTS